MLRFITKREGNMTAITFDTLAFANRLKHAGVSTQQAEAQAEAMAEVLSVMTEDTLATKADIHELRHATKENIRDLEIKLTARMGAISAATIAILSTLLVILHH